MTNPELSEYFLEISGRNGAVSERVSLDDNPIIIGRGYDCQVIVEDPYVCPQHIRVTLAENGELVIEDLASVNGLSVSRHGEKKMHLRLHPGEDCYIGSTKISYRCRHDQVAATRRDHSRQFIFNALQQPGMMALIIIVPFLMLLYTVWLEQAREMELHAMLISPASIYIFLIIWAFVWSMAGKLIVHRAMFFTHLAIISALIAVTTIVEAVTSYGVFMFDVDLLLRDIQYVTGFIIITMMIYAHLHFASRGRPKMLLTASAVVAVVLISISAYIEFESDSLFSSSPQYSALLKPPMFVIGSVQTTDEFLSDMASVESAIEILKQSEK